MHEHEALVDVHIARRELVEFTATRGTLHRNANEVRDGLVVLRVFRKPIEDDFDLIGRRTPLTLICCLDLDFPLPPPLLGSGFRAKRL